MPISSLRTNPCDIWIRLRMVLIQERVFQKSCDLIAGNFVVASMFWRSPFLTDIIDQEFEVHVLQNTF